AHPAVEGDLTPPAPEQGRTVERDVKRIAKMIWGTLLQSGRIEMPTKAEVVQFLQEHRYTYLAQFNVDRALGFIQARKEPTSGDELFRVPKLIGQNRAVSGSGPARLQDDLTERIYVAYRALRRAKVRNARGRIAETLNRLRLETRPRSKTAGSWGSAEVND